MDANAKHVVANMVLLSVVVGASSMLIAILLTVDL